MDTPIEYYWQKRLEDLQSALEDNNFEAHIASDAAEAKKVVLEQIIPELEFNTISWGGSLTFVQSGLYQELKENSEAEVMDTMAKDLTPEAMLELRRQALLADLFITGSNAVTETGQLVNLDMIGNRVGAITFGPKHVIIMVGRNKIVADLDEAMYRIKSYASPTNSMRLDKKTPCAKTAYCQDCKSPERICNYWTITEKSFPKGRIKVVLINQDLGL